MIESFENVELMEQSERAPDEIFISDAEEKEVTQKSDDESEYEENEQVIQKGKPRCTFQYFGKTLVSQAVFYCESCDPSHAQELCRFCYETCHEKCTKQNKIAEGDEKYRSFFCDCGSFNHLVRALPRNKKGGTCSLYEFDRPFQESLKLCKQHKIALCNYCSIRCHPDCDVEILEPSTQEQKCNCSGINHAFIEGKYAVMSIDNFMEKCGFDNILPIQLLNYFFVERMHERVLSLIDIEKRNRILFQFLSNSFDSDEFNKACYFAPDVLTQIAPFYPNLLEPSSKEKLALCANSMNVYLYTQLKSKFNAMKSCTSSDFLALPIIERLLYRNKIDTYFGHSKNFILIDHLKYFDTCLLFFKDLEYEFRRSSQLYRTFLQFFNFYLKRMLLSYDRLSELINCLERYHKKFLEYVAANDDNINQFKENIYKLVEMYFLIAVNWNDITTFKIETVSANAVNCQYIQNSNNKKLFQMVLEAFDLLKFIYKKGKNEEGQGKAYYFWRLAKESINLFCFTDNFYYTQLKQFTIDSGKLTVGMQTQASITNDDVLFLKKNEIEDALSSFFTKIPNESAHAELKKQIEGLYEQISNMVFEQFPIPEEIANTPHNCLLKLYPAYKSLRSKLTGDNKFIEKLIFFNFDDTITKILLLFMQNDTYSSAHSFLEPDHVNMLLSILLLFLTSERGFTYFMLGKNISRIVKLLDDYPPTNEPESTGSIGLYIFQFLQVTFKHLQKYKITLQGHKMLESLRSFFFEYLQNVRIKDGHFKFQLIFVMKIFYALSDSYGYEEFEEVQKFILIMFSSKNLLKIEEISMFILNYPNHTCPCCGSVRDLESEESEARVNIRMYFLFFKLISKNTYYMTRSREKLYQFLFDQDLLVYRDILSSNMLCLKAREILLSYLKTFYFIDRLNTTDYLTRAKNMKPNEYVEYVYYILEKDKNKDKDNDQDNHPWYIETALPRYIVPDKNSTKFNSQKAIKKREAAERTINVLNIFIHEFENFTEIIQKPDSKRFEKRSYIRELLLSTHYISSYFYSEGVDNFIQLVISSFNNFVSTFILKCGPIIDEYYSKKNVLTQRKTTFSLDPEIIEEVRNNGGHINHMLQAFPAIFNHIKLDFTIAPFFKEYDTLIERTLQQSVFNEENDYEYFYEPQDQQMKRGLTFALVTGVETVKKKSFMSYQTTENTVFNDIIGGVSKGLDEKIIRQMLVYNFLYFCTVKSKSTPREISEFYLELMSKMVYFSVQEAKEIFVGIEASKIPQFVGDFLLENIVHSIALSKNFPMRAKLLRVNYMARLILQFMQILKVTFTAVIFLSPKEMKEKRGAEEEIEYKFNASFEKDYDEERSYTENGSEYIGEWNNNQQGNNQQVDVQSTTSYEEKVDGKIIEGSDTLMGLINNNLILCYSLLPANQGTDFDFPNDTLIVLATNLTNFVLSFSNITEPKVQERVHDLILRLFTECDFGNLYLNCRKLDYHTNSLKMYYMCNMLLQLLVSYLPLTEESYDDDDDDNNPENIADELLRKKKQELVIGRVKNDMNPAQLYDLMTENIKNLINDNGILTKDNSAGQENIQDGNNNNKSRANFIFKKIEEKYSSDSQFKENLQLKFIFKMLTLFKILADDYSIFELGNLRKENDFDSMLFFHMMQFVTKIEIKNNNNLKVAMYFIKPPLSLYLSKKTQDDFVWNVDRENAETKLTALVTKRSFFMLDMIFNSMERELSVFRFLKFSHMHLLNFLIIITENALLLAIFYRSHRMAQKEYDADVDIFGVPEWDLWLGIAHVPFLVFFIIYSLFLSHKSIKKVSMKKKIERQMQGASQSGSVIELIYNLLQGRQLDGSIQATAASAWANFGFIMGALLENVDFWIFLLNLALLIIYLSTRNPIWLVLPTLLVMYVNAALSNIIYALKHSWYKLLTVLLFTYLCIYVFMWFNMLYLTELFSFDAITNGEKISENFCQSSLPCLLLMIDKGIRNGGGIGDSMNLWSYQTHVDLFVMRFFYVMLFHIIIVLILRNVFLGIIVDAYQALRDKTDKDTEDLKSICFICQLTTDQSATANIDFNTHIQTTHDLWNYIYFLTYLNMKNSHDFTANEEFVWEKIKQNDISWFPVLD